LKQHKEVTLDPILNIPNHQDAARWEGELDRFASPAGHRTQKKNPEGRRAQFHQNWWEVIPTRRSHSSFFPSSIETGVDLPQMDDQSFNKIKSMHRHWY
jgi:hypothetical protein